MKLDQEFYENLTAGQLEENIEFIDWEFVPGWLITTELRFKFPLLAGKILEGQLVRTLKEELKKAQEDFKEEKAQKEKDRNILKNHYKHILKKRKRK